MNPCQAHDFENNETMDINIGSNNSTKLTGKFSFDKDLFGDLILYVEYKHYSEPYTRWRKGTFKDLPYLNFTK